MLQTSKHKKKVSNDDNEEENGDSDAKLTFSSNGKIVMTLEMKYSCDEHSQKQCWVALPADKGKSGSLNIDGCVFATSIMF